MDNSQSSDCFPENADSSYRSPMDTPCYKSLVGNTKHAITAAMSIDVQKSTFTTYFISLLDDCSNCIEQSFDLVTGLLADREVCLTKLTEYLNDAVCLLQLLTNFIRNVVVSVSMACCSMKRFPTTTGHIIFTVFSHCKNSEALYGKNLTHVEKQLKDLFRNCHELQLIYLMILEKHFVFDVTNNDEKNLLIEVFHINLRIGEIVHSLDVKTMAEQWKAYTQICEKYCAALVDTSMFHDCTQVLCMLIKKNMNAAIENIQDDKIVMRSLKVASFTIKILLKTCNIFKDAVTKDYANVLDMMFFLQTTGFSNLALTAEKYQFKNLINVSIVNPSECLLKELLSDGTFCNSLLNCDLDSKNDVGFFLTISSAMKCLTHGYRSKTVSKTMLIDCVYRFLPYCHRWLKHELKLESGQVQTHGLFEHLLVHTAALAFTMNLEEFVVLERTMAESILGVDSFSALFSGNLWAIMARHVTPQLLFNQLVWLCTMYKQLENKKLFHRSPQKVHLSSTISKLFGVMAAEDKIKICIQFRIHDDDNVGLWTALRVNNLPDEDRIAAEEVVTEKLKAQFQWFNGKDTGGIIQLIQVINLAATCTFTNIIGIEDFVMRAWSKTCHKHHFQIHNVDGSTIWFYDYLEALISLTDTIWHRLCERNVYLTQLLDWISGLIQQCNTEIKLLLTKTLCKLAASNICQDKHADDNFTQSFTCLCQESENIVQNMMFVTLSTYARDKNLDRTLSNIENDSLQESWCKIKEGLDCNVKENIDTVEFKFSHKCYENKVNNEMTTKVELRKAPSSNFDFADMEELFNDSDSEQPLCKRIKLNDNDAEGIIKRLESDASLLCKVKENVFKADYKSRVQNVCDKLINIIK